MTKLAPEWVRTSDPVIRSPARYRWTTAPASHIFECNELGISLSNCAIALKFGVWFKYCTYCLYMDCIFVVFTARRCHSKYNAVEDRPQDIHLQHQRTNSRHAEYVAIKIIFAGYYHQGFYN